MNYVHKTGEVSWLLIKLIFELLWKHLPYFILIEFLGFILAIILSILLIRICKKKGIFSRESESKFSLFLNKAYKPLMFLSMFFLTMTFATHFALTRIVKKEITHGVEASFDYLETHYLKKESTRLELYQMGELILKGGSYIKDFNQAIVLSANEFKVPNSSPGFLSAKLSGFMVSRKLEEKLIEIEKGTLFYLIGLALHKMEVDPGDLYDYDVFEKVFDKWYDLEFDATAVGLEETISSFTYKYVKPVVFSIFVPFLLIGLSILLIPFIHFFFYKRKMKKLKSANKTITTS